MNFIKYVVAGMAVVGLFVAGPAQAETFAQKHPRRAQVIRRDNRDTRANNRALRNGKISGSQDRKLDREDRSIRRQERRDARNNGGHITKAEQRHLNREETGVNRQRRADERADAVNH
jgi:hypothetical protein